MEEIGERDIENYGEEEKTEVKEGRCICSCVILISITYIILNNIINKENEIFKNDTIIFLSNAKSY